MKKAASIFMLSIYMLSFSEFHQFLKVPVLVQHFIEHRQQDRSISFWSFLKDHYAHQYQAEEDYLRNNHLPFQDTDCCIVTAQLSVECPVAGIEVSGNTVEIQNEFILYDEDNHSLISVADIFQPPRFI